MCTRQVHDFPNLLIYLYRNEHIEILSGAWILLHMHPVCAQNKSLISDTEESVPPPPPGHVLTWPAWGAYPYTPYEGLDLAIRLAGYLTGSWREATSYFTDICYRY